MIRPRRGNYAVFFAHDATEKALKGAYWHLLAEEPPWTHDLQPLAAGLPEAAGIAGGAVPNEITQAMSDLMSIWENSRYPSGDADEPIPSDLVDTTEAAEAIKSAESVIEWVAGFLQLPSGKPKRSRS